MCRCRRGGALSCEQIGDSLVPCYAFDHCCRVWRTKRRWLRGGRRSKVYSQPLPVSTSSLYSHISLIRYLPQAPSDLENQATDVREMGQSEKSQDELEVVTRSNPGWTTSWLCDPV